MLQTPCLKLRIFVQNYDFLAFWLLILTFRGWQLCHTAQTEMCADLKSERRGTENISQCSQSECLCAKNLFREHFAGVVYREHMNGPRERAIYIELWGTHLFSLILLCTSQGRFLLFSHGSLNPQVWQNKAIHLCCIIPSKVAFVKGNHVHIQTTQDILYTKLKCSETCY